MELLSSYLKPSPSLTPSGADGRAPAITPDSWAAGLEGAAAPGKGLYHLRNTLFLVGQGFWKGLDFRSHLIDLGHPGRAAITEDTMLSVSQWGMIIGATPIDALDAECPVGNPV